MSEELSPRERNWYRIVLIIAICCFVGFCAHDDYNIRQCAKMSADHTIYSYGQCYKVELLK